MKVELRNGVTRGLALVLVLVLASVLTLALALALTFVLVLAVALTLALRHSNCGFVLAPALSVTGLGVQCAHYAEKYLRKLVKWRATLRGLACQLNDLGFAPRFHFLTPTGIAKQQPGKIKIKSKKKKKKSKKKKKTLDSS